MFGPAFANHLTEPFLLIVRTERIFTAYATPKKQMNGTDEYRRILGVSSILTTTHHVGADVEGSTHCTLWEFLP